MTLIDGRESDGRGRFVRALAYAIQFFFGGWFFFNGINYFVEFTPPPPGSAPATRDLMTGLESTGLFAIVKLVELVTGAALLLNRFVPLAAIVAFPVTFAIAYVMLVINGGMVGTIVGLLALAFNGVIALSRLEHFIPLLAFRDAGPFPVHGSVRAGRGRFGGARGKGLSLRVHLLAIALGVGLPVMIELATMAYFQAVARDSMTIEGAGRAPLPVVR